ncbi:Arf guanyl-nucleotide exchange factor [Heterostelium album PN500]|uniref:Arf guanyl-nucleotide exchange factor n=1 Tax=Heterostelium pallidum (strain ATCC 26659 / Pp 5 / PN500) TaxID=670386 RepID=D3BJV8_HETP5|nr:Arf guanyl-nucleotide exchange factor [Heterostelium album PN500]EFA78188.1 Arf guanyl-nucleotide exchange factor [Heterostelium album PN500]|eukprot:XP_020430314.1 Arf guanyl-nucleotide exchange factor [Heterostelium album PN500]
MFTSFNPIHIIQGEIYGLLSHLKLNTRWSSNQSLLPDNSILKSLKNLTNILHNESNFESLDTSTYLDPFLLVIRSAETSGPITGTALTSVNKFLNLFIDSESNNAPKAIRSIAESVTHCKFEATDSKSDEVVLMKILQVLSSCMKNAAGIYLTNDLVYESMNTCFLMTDQSRSSELLKKTAETTLQEIVTIAFQRYNIYHSPPTPPPLPHLNSEDQQQQQQQQQTQQQQQPQQQQQNKEEVVVENEQQQNVVPLRKSSISATLTITTTTTSTTTTVQENLVGGSNEIDKIISSFTDEPSSSATSHLHISDDNQFSPNNDLFFSNLPHSGESLVKPNDSTHHHHHHHQDSNNNNNHNNNHSGSHSPKSPVSNNTTPVSTPVTQPVQHHHHSLPTNSLSSTPPINLNNNNNHQQSNNNNNNSNSSGYQQQNKQQRNSLHHNITVVNPKLNQNHLVDSDKSYDETVLIKILKFFVDNIMRGSTLESSTGIIAVIQDDLFKYLLQNLCKSIPIFSLSMRIFFNLFVSLRHCLKAQFEEFFNVLLKNIVDNKQLFELQELALEGLRDFCKFPLAMVELFVNYDCEIYSSNVFESLCKTLYKNSFPLSGPLNTLHMLSLENLLSIIQSIDDRSKYPRYIPHSQLPASDSLEFMKKKKFKKIMSIAATHFNRKPADAFNYLLENKIFTEINAKSISKFFLETPKLNLKTVGEYIGKKSNKEVLSEYLDYFIERYDGYISVYRAFLESFIIPGESAVVEHIFELLARKIYENLESRGKHIFQTEDSLFLCLYSGLMLHTSTFNPNISAKDRMTYQSFERMLIPCHVSSDLIKDMFNEMTVQLCAEDETTTPGVITNSTWRNTLKNWLLTTLLLLFNNIE